MKRLQEALFRVLVRKPMASLDAVATGKLLSRLTTDTALVGDVVGLNLNVASRSLLRLMLTTGFLATLSLPLTGVALASSAAFFAVTFVFSRFQRVAAKGVRTPDAFALQGGSKSGLLLLIRTVSIPQPRRRAPPTPTTSRSSR